jgi:hypothetical protein
MASITYHKKFALDDAIGRIVDVPMELPVGD